MKPQPIQQHPKHKLAKFFWTVGIGSAILLSHPLLVQAGGTLGLTDLDPLIEQSPELQQTINQTLQEINRTAEEIICFGGRVGGQFGALGAERFAPFYCYFQDNQILHIEAKNWVTLPDGTRFPLEELPNLPTLPPEMSLSFELESWQWQEKAP